MNRLAYLTLYCCATYSIAAEDVDFDRDVRPILSENCFHCHGPDGAARKAELRLDTKEGTLGVVSKTVDESQLFSRITADDVDERMPPQKTGLKLSKEEIETIRSWIEQGANWTKHWSFEPPKRYQAPKVTKADWPRNEIDHFVLARLEKHGLSPSDVASRETLIRRVTLDLTGFPPTLDEIDAFLSDKSDDAYEKVVDRLLKSSRYGERMAWEWLDAARYADTDGFQGDPTRTMWPWRDWLIKALNDNKPFDEFTIEMLAGDLLPNRTIDQLVATGFNRNHMYNGEGGRIAEETRVENVFDRAETTSTVWLGLTMTCSRCHDHKYDPITQREYYQMFAFFNNTSENGGRGGGRAPPTMRFLPPEKRQQIKGLEGQIAELRQKLNGPMPQVDEAQNAWEIESTKQVADAANATNKLVISPWSLLGTLPAPQGNGGKAFDHEYGPEKGVDLARKYVDNKIAWRTDEKLVDGKVHELPQTVGATYLYRTFDSPDARSLDVSFGSDDGIRVWLNGKQLVAKNVARAAAADQERAKLELKKGKNELLMKIVNTGGIGGFYFKIQSETVGGFPADIVAILKIESAKRNASQKKKLRDFYRSKFSDEWKKLNAEVAKLDGQRAAIDKSGATVMVMDEMPKSRTTKVLFRGIYNKPTEVEVTSGTPSFLPPLAGDEAKNRLALAKWLVDPNHPLTARVTVNRYWQTFFGKGIVSTTEDFGRQGKRPSHPQLLDWLATKFIDSGWDVKAMHKTIVMSATYRQSSKIVETVDPGNQFLARASRYRMPSWMLRDQALAVSGLLADKIGGPSVKPYQPPGIWADATFGKIRYTPDKGENLYRRSLYIFWRRIVGPTMFFDGGKRQTCEVKPTRTNTPLHALTTLNETTFVEASRAMAQRVMKEDATSTENRIKRAFRMVTARWPTDEELALVVNRWKIVKKEFEAQPDQAEKLLTVGDSPRDEALDKSEHAAYTVICSLLFNLDEVITRE